MKPLILITPSVSDDGTIQLYSEYSNAVAKAGGIPVCMPYISDYSQLNDYINLFDGFFFTGGKDVMPHRYNESAINDTLVFQKLRDEFEFKFLDAVYKTNKPIIGVCRGMQVINVYLGGSLYQDIPTQIENCIRHRQVEPRYSFSHSVNVLLDTPLYNMAKSSNANVNSFHHQCIKTLGKDLSVMATANDGVIEALYSKTHKYLRLYQWHPERLYESDELNLNIFKEFVDNCKK